MRLSEAVKKGFKYLINKNYRFLINSHFGFYNSMSDEAFLEKKFKITMRKDLSLENPKTFNEKVQWLKLYDRKPEYTIMVDKYKVREYIKEKLGEEYLIPLIGVWDSPDEIDFDKLPNQFVLKCNHNSGLGMCICKDKSKLNIKKVKEELRKGLKQDYYLTGREWPYKDVPRKIVCEKFMVDESGYELKDYKYFCFNGEPKIMFIASDRQIIGEETKFDFYDMNFNHLPFTNGHPCSKKKIACPKAFDKMKELAAVLSKDIPLLRVDFYEINGKVYFGELTFSHWSGMVPFEPKEWDYKLGEWIDLKKL